MTRQSHTGGDTDRGSDRQAATSLPEGKRDSQICVARIGAAHGIRGDVRLWTFTEDPLSVADYGPLTTKDGKRQFSLKSIREAKDHLVATLEGVTSREAAEALNGVELYIARANLPPPDDDEFYHADLIGLRAISAGGETLGSVVTVHNFGAGDILEISGPGGSAQLFPFTMAVVPAVDLAAGTVTIAPPVEIEGDPDAPEA